MSTFGLFSQSNAQPGTAAPSTGIFGQQQQQQQQQPATGGLFGQPQQQQPAQTGGLFGGQTQPGTTAAGGGLFGSTAPAQGTSLFGNTANQNQQQQQPPPSGGLFGNQQAAAPATTGLFGQQQQPTTGLFGQPAQSQTQQQPGLFGAPATTSNPPVATGTGLFGGPAATQPSGGGLFGIQQQQPQGTSLFNQPVTQQQQQPAAPTGGLGLFGSTTQQPAAGLLGPPPSGLNGSTATTTRPGGVGGAPIQDRVKVIYDAWNPESPTCAFTHYFYNSVDSQQLPYYTRPPTARNDMAWEQAMRANPDPTSMVPVPAIGFEDLQKRANAQAKFAELQQQQLKEASDRLSTLSQRHTLSTSIRLHRLSLTQTEITQRIAILVKRLHLMLPSVRATSIRPEEERLRAVLEGLEEEMKRPGGLGRMKGKLSELWTAVGAVRALKDRSHGGMGMGGAGGGGGGAGEAAGWTVVDEGGLNELTAVLQNEQQGISYVMAVLKQDKADMEVIEAGLGEAATGLVGSGGVAQQQQQRAGMGLGMSRNQTQHQGNLSASLLGVRS